MLLAFLLISMDVSGQESAIPHTISVVTDDNFPPYVFRDNEGRLQGIIIDQWRVWEKRTGVTAEIHGMDWNDAVRRMKEGEFDVIDAMFKTPERTAYLDFGKQYTTIEVSIFFRSSIAGINNLSSLRGFPVAAKLGDTVVKLLQGLFDEAVRTRASDIHIEPHAQAVAIRLRVDGHLRPHAEFESRLAPALRSRGSTTRLSAGC